MYRLIVVLVCLIFYSFPVVSDEWDEAVLAFDTQRYPDVFRLLAPLAQPENVGVQLLLVDTYVRGSALMEDDEARLDWTRRGAKLGIATAQEQLAYSYLYGDGVTLDEQRAAHWFAEAADQWRASAIYNLGVLTMNGQGVPPDPDYAVRLFQRAADLDDPHALYVLGSLHLEGVYVQPDFDSSLYYLSRAALLGQRRAMVLMGVLIQERQDDPNRLVKSAFHFKRALAAGCDDIADLAAEAIERLSPDEMAMLDHNLAAWQPDTAPHDMNLERGHCLS